MAATLPTVLPFRPREVVVWMDTKGAFADPAVGVTDINYDEGDNRAYYKKQVAARDVISGKVTSSGGVNPSHKEMSGS